MKVKSATQNLAKKALYESLSADMMVRVMRMIVPGYDINERTGIPDNIPITSQMAAERIVRDVIDNDQFLIFIETLIKIDANGYMGREYPIQWLIDLIKAVMADGYLYDRATGLFMENSKERQTPNWGRLQNGEEMQVCLLRLDIVRNSELVKGNDKAKIDQAYSDLRNIVSRAVVPRLGRVWFWEGDGSVCAFLFGPKERSSILAGMEILNELFFYNLVLNPLKENLTVRIAATCGPVTYSSDPTYLKKSETVKEVMNIESRHAKTGCFSVSQALFLPIDRVLQDRFSPEINIGGIKARSYTVAVEE